MNYKRSLLYAILNTIILISFIVNNKNLLNRRPYYILGDIKNNPKSFRNTKQ